MGASDVYGIGNDKFMYEKAVAVVRETGRASISLVQRHLRIGYNRAARLVEQMEQDGIVSPYRQNGMRDVLAKNREAMLVNPYTGEARDIRDVDSDPFGLLVIDPSKPLIAAKERA